MIKSLLKVYCTLIKFLNITSRRLCYHTHHFVHVFLCICVCWFHSAFSVFVGQSQFTFKMMLSTVGWSVLEVNAGYIFVPIDESYKCISSFERLFFFAVVIAMNLIQWFVYGYILAIFAHFLCTFVLLKANSLLSMFKGWGIKLFESSTSLFSKLKVKLYDLNSPNVIFSNRNNPQLSS